MQCGKVCSQSQHVLKRTIGLCYSCGRTTVSLSLIHIFLLNGEVVGPTPDVVALAEEARAE